MSLGRRWSAPFIIMIIAGTVIPICSIVYYGFTSRSGGFTTHNIMAMFDNDEAKIGKVIHGIPVLPVSGIVDYINENDIEIVILTIPKEAARELLHELEGTKIKGVWNFAHTDFEMPGGIVVENVHLSESLMRLSYEIANPGEPV